MPESSVAHLDTDSSLFWGPLGPVIVGVKSMSPDGRNPRPTSNRIQLFPFHPGQSFVTPSCSVVVSLFIETVLCIFSLETFSHVAKLFTPLVTRLMYRA